MNWTGGEYSKAIPTKQKALRQQQKAHFARARAAIQLQGHSAAYRRRYSSQGIINGDLNPTQKLDPAKHRWQPRARGNQHASFTGVDDQELRLLVKRQELLQRSDWLELQATRPVRIQFEAEAEKDMIGRRRKIHKPRIAIGKAHTIRDQPKVLPVTIPWQTESSIDLQIGTAALSTQTQLPKFAAINDPRPRVRAAPELDLLSEEPMLLDSDEDIWEDCVEVNNDSQVEQPIATHSPAANTFDTPNQPVSWSTTPVKVTALKYADANQVRNRVTPLYKMPDMLAKSTEHADVNSVSSRATSSHRQTGSIKHQGSDSSEQPTSSEQRKQYGKCWQQVLGMPTTSQMYASNVAVKSFADASSSSERPVIIVNRRLPSDARQFTPVRDSLSESLQVHLSETSNENPSASLRTTQTIVERCSEKHQDPLPSPVQVHCKETKKTSTLTKRHDCSSGDDIWRQFIIGDETSEQSD